MKIQFNINRQHIVRTDFFRVVAGSRNYITCGFSFSSDWNGKVKTAVFRKGDTVYNLVLSDDEIPSSQMSFLDEGCWSVSVFGGDLITADTALLRVYPSGYARGSASSDPPQSVYDTLVELVATAQSTAESAVEIAQGIADEAEAGAFNGSNGTEGTDGTNGKSAYEIAVQNGYSGTETQWLASLVGAAGADGIDGTNGINGTNGKSAYEIAVQNGYSGTETQWLASLVGAAGTDGTDGIDGTNGINGTNGKSAYEIAVQNGYSGTETQWLASLVGATGATGAAGAAGAAGATGAKGADGYSPAVSVSKSGNAATISVTDKNGTSSAVIYDGTTPTVDGELSGSSVNPVRNNVIKAAIDGKQTKILAFNNIQASSWISDSTYSGYGYKCVLALSGVTASSFVSVVFGAAEAESGNYAPVADSASGSVSIYSKTNTAITVKTIIAVPVA